MKKLALVLCMVPGIGFAQNITDQFFAQTSATGLSRRCIIDVAATTATIQDLLIWVSTTSQNGLKSAQYVGCSDPITNTQGYQELRADLESSGYTVTLDTNTGIMTISWP